MQENILESASSVRANEINCDKIYIVLRILHLKTDFESNHEIVD